MTRVVIVNQGQDQLCQTMTSQIDTAIVQSNFKWVPAAGDVICWLPSDTQRVDDEVSQLVQLLDQHHVQPGKIIMKSIVGTADDASLDQLNSYYGADARNMLMDHLYAIKMIDELEFPYTIVRSLPLTEEPVERGMLDEGQLFTGAHSNVTAVADLLIQALDVKKFKNRSIGI